MAIEHLLYVGEGTSAEDVLELVCRADSVRPQRSVGRLGFVGAHVQGVAWVTDDVVRRVLSEDLDIAAHLTVLFRLDKFELATAEDVMVACIARVLDGCPSDLALLAHGDVEALRRVGGALTVHDHVGLWTPERLGLVGDEHSGPTT